MQHHRKTVRDYIRTIVDFPHEGIMFRYVTTLFADPRHPYTRALLDTVPRVDGTRDTRLRSISGQPPALNKPLTTCPFAPRCPQALARCHLENPPLVALGDDHDVACWWDAKTGGVRFD